MTTTTTTTTTTTQQPRRIGQNVRSFDFDSRDVFGPRACYLEGTVVGIETHPEGGYKALAILVKRDVQEGQELTGTVAPEEIQDGMSHADDGSRVGTVIRTPQNGTVRLGRSRKTDHVHKLAKGVSWKPCPWRSKGTSPREEREEREARQENHVVDLDPKAREQIEAALEELGNPDSPTRIAAAQTALRLVLALDRTPATSCVPKR